MVDFGSGLRVLWQRTVPDGPQPADRAVQLGGILVHEVMNQTGLRALSARDGRVLWEHSRGTTLLAADLHTVVAISQPFGAEIVGLSLQDGTEMWRHDAGGDLRQNNHDNPARSPLLRIGDQSYIQVIRPVGAFTDRLYLRAIDPTSGSLGPLVRTSGGSPACEWQGRAYAEAHESVSCFDGTRVTQIPTGRTSRDPKIHEPGLLVTFDPVEGRDFQIWDMVRNEEVARFEGRRHAHHAVRRDCLIVATDRLHVACRELGSHTGRWHVTLPGVYVDEIRWLGRDHIVVSGTGHGALLEVATGTVLGGTTSHVSAPTLGHGCAFVWVDAELFCIECPAHLR